MLVDIEDIVRRWPSLKLFEPGVQHESQDRTTGAPASPWGGSLGWPGTATIARIGMGVDGGQRGATGQPIVNDWYTIEAATQVAPHLRTLSTPAT